MNEALQEMFHGKCYICENNKSSVYQIEHLVPHRGNKDLKYDWNNLFWACGHCNNIKLAKYDPIIDCTQEDVEKLIAFRKEEHFGTDEKFVFEMLDSRIEVKNTVDLLREVYYGSTPQKKIGAKILRKFLREELAAFKRWLIRDNKDAYPELTAYI